MPDRHLDTEPPTGHIKRHFTWPFFGHRGHVALSVVGWPTTLWSRVDTLGGALTVDSTEGAVRLEFSHSSATGKATVKKTVDGRPSPIGLVRADDHPMLLEGLERVFEAHPGFTVVARCLDGEEALRAVRQHKPNVLILDIRMPGTDGFDVLREIRTLEEITF